MFTANGYQQEMQIQRFSEVNKYYIHASIKGVQPNSSGYCNLKR